MFVLGQLTPTETSSAHRCESDALGVEAYVDAFFFEESLCMDAETSSSSRVHEARAHLDDGDLAAEAAEDLRELDADVAATDDDEMARKGVEFEDADVGEEGDLVDAGQIGDDWRGRRR